MINYYNIQQSVIAEAEYPVTRSEAKAWCKIDFTDEDTLIDSLIIGATEAVEKFTNRALVNKSVSFDVVTTDYCDRIRLLFTDKEQTLTITDIDAEEEVLTDYYKNRGADVTINYAGYFNIEYDIEPEVPESLKEAILMEIANRYNRRGDDEAALSKAAKSKAAPFQIVWL